MQPGHLSILPAQSFVTAYAAITSKCLLITTRRGKEHNWINVTWLIKLLLVELNQIFGYYSGQIFSYSTLVTTYVDKI